MTKPTGEHVCSPVPTLPGSSHHGTARLWTQTWVQWRLRSPAIGGWRGAGGLVRQERAGVAGDRLRDAASDQTKMPKRLLDGLTLFGGARFDATTPTGAARRTARR